MSTGAGVLLDAILKDQIGPSPSETLTFPEVLDVFHMTKYTGVTVMHWHQGQIKAVDVPNPTRVKVVI